MKKDDVPARAGRCPSLRHRPGIHPASGKAGAAFYGLTNGDITTKIKSGDHKGENKYWRNIKKYNLPFFKDWEQMQKMSEDESIFQVFKDTPSNH